MRMRRRIEAIEERLGVGKDRVVAVFYDGVHEEPARTMARRARERGFSFAETAEEAPAVLERMRAERPYAAIRVFRRTAPGKDLLASWTPPLPDWLRAKETP